MEKLSKPQKTIEIIRDKEFTFRKKFGQNFLIDERVLDKIIAAANVEKKDFVLEIGPGIGTLTQPLAEAAAQVVAVEIDRELIPILEETLADYDNIEILNQDILKVDIKALSLKYNRGQPFKVIGNLPYHITTPIVMGLLESDAPIESITVMVQEEVGMRMQAGPGTKDYGALSLAVQYYAEPHLAAHVPPNCFLPRPNVGSAVIHLTIRKKPSVQTVDEKLLFAVIRASFNQRRKTIVNALSNGLDYRKEEIQDAVKQAGLPENVRGESLSLEQFAALTDALVQRR